ncbi:MAG: GTP pyrophosphokinase family protein [Lachnospiraceae bacterium]|nr:GTP pyrophosphokinase family protein [Lachnospiraceae bacterium]
MGSIYGQKYTELEDTMRSIVDEIGSIREIALSRSGFDPIEHISYRIKTEESMLDKIKRKGLPLTTESALEAIHDAVGIRVVCAFINDIYAVRDHLLSLKNCEVIEEKDYIRHAKENGYRSYHMIVKVNGSIYVEIQLRTISQDTWAALEHHIHYKKDKTDMDKLISAELKRCADELASTDLSMQTIRDMIEKNRNEQEQAG